MKIVVFMGSPNRNGSTGILADYFRKGAEEAGHSAEVIDVCSAYGGIVLGYGCGTPGMTKRSRYPQEAYQLGRSL